MTNLLKKVKVAQYFLHIARENYLPTAGCIAFNKSDLLEILAHIGPEAMLRVTENGKIAFQTIEPAFEIVP